MRIYSIKRTHDLETLEYLDRKIFPYDDRLDFNKDVWWLVMDWTNRAVGFCGVQEFPEEGFVFFKRAGILHAHRGNRLHGRMLRVRLRYSRRNKYVQSITYTLHDNIISSNNLIKSGFLLYDPPCKWAGNALYWVKWNISE